MRIISGTHKGRKINPGNKLNLRPTTDRSKEALFNILENRYYFDNKNSRIREVLRKTISGGGCVNDTLFQVSQDLF